MSKSPNDSAELRAMLGVICGFCSAMCCTILGISSRRMLGEHLDGYRVGLLIGIAAFMTCLVLAVYSALVRRREWTAEFVTAIGLSCFLAFGTLFLLFRFFTS